MPRRKAEFADGATASAGDPIGEREPRSGPDGAGGVDGNREQGMKAFCRSRHEDGRRNQWHGNPGAIEPGVGIVRSSSEL